MFEAKTLDTMKLRDDSYQNLKKGFCSYIVKIIEVFNQLRKN